MSASVAVRPEAKPCDRSIKARRAARRARFERERLIVDCLNRGVSVAGIAQRIGVTEKRMRALVKEILARRMPAAPEDFAALQVSRLNEALLVAYSAMSAENLRAVGLVVRIVRELDRYHGFVAFGRGPAASRAPRTPSRKKTARARGRFPGNGAAKPKTSSGLARRCAGASQAFHPDAGARGRRARRAACRSARNGAARD